MLSQHNFVSQHFLYRIMLFSLDLYQNFSNIFYSKSNLKLFFKHKLLSQVHSWKKD